MRKRLARSLLSGLLWHTIGRKNMVRLARFLANESRLDVDNDPETSGEYATMRAFLAQHDRSGLVRAIDAGANVGSWTKVFVEMARDCHQEPIVDAFEPCQKTCETLTSNVTAWGMGSCVRTNRVALSSARGQRPFYSLGANRGTNSLYELEDAETVHVEKVELVTLDEYCAAHQIGHVDYLKIDTEGHEMEVLAGCRNLIAAQKVELVQFEYNRCWIRARSFLKDAFQLFRPAGFELGKITPLGIEFYGDWNHELETFREANFIAVRRPWRSRFKEVPWWNCS
jgi:FkbM family methyltransferase